MKYKLLFSLIALLLINRSCRRPINHYENGLAKFENIFSEDRLSEFKKKSESVAIIDVWDQEGYEFKNEFLKNKKGEDLVLFFESKGITKYPYMLEIMITSLHRKLNFRELNLESQIKEKSQYLDSIKVCEEIRKFKGRDYFNTNSIGDTLIIYYPVLKKFQTAVYVDCPNMNWKFNEDRDLSVKGIVVNKNVHRDLLEFNYDVQIIEMSNWNIKILNNNITKGDTVSITLNNVLIEQMDSNGR